MLVNFHLKSPFPRILADLIVKTVLMYIFRF